MQIQNIISQDHIACGQDIRSKKRALERLSELLAINTPSLTAPETFDALIGRERLGSTGFGKGAAIPHGRIAGLEQPTAAFLSLPEGVDFDAVDSEPVDLFFALLVPEQQTEEHLQLLSQIAAMFSDPAYMAQLRQANDESGLFTVLRHWEPHRVTA